MRKTFLIIVTISILGFLAYWISEIYQISDLLENNTPEIEQVYIQQKIKNGDIIFQT